MSYILEIDRRRELIAALQIDPAMLGEEDQEEKEEEDRFNPFHHKDFIIMILEWAPPDVLHKLYRANKYIREVIQESKNYVLLIAEFKYQTVCNKYEHLLKAYKAREDALHSFHMGISKAIKEEEEKRDTMLNKINNLGLSNNYLGYKLSKARAGFINDSINEEAKIPEPVPVYNIDDPSIKFEEHKSKELKEKAEPEPDLDDEFERKKLASLQDLYAYQKKIELSMPLYQERQMK